MERKRRTALIPNASNSMAEAIRDRTRCKICGERINTGDDIWSYEDGSSEHVGCAATSVLAGPALTPSYGVVPSELSREFPGMYDDHVRYIPTGKTTSSGSVLDIPTDLSLTIQGEFGGVGASLEEIYRLWGEPKGYSIELVNQCVLEATRKGYLRVDY